MNYSEQLLKKSFDKNKYQQKAITRKSYYDEYGFNDRVENWVDVVWQFCYEFNLVYIDGIYDRIHPDVKDTILDVFGLDESDLY